MGGTPTATFALDLKDETAGAAKAAAAALLNLKSVIDDDVKSLREMQKAMKRLTSGTTTNVAAFRSLNKRITEQKSKISKSQASFVEMGGTFTKTGKKSRSLSELLKGLGGDAAKSGVSMGAMGGVATRLGAALANPVGVAIALGAALLAISVAAVAATVALLRFGVAAAGAARSEALQIEGLNTLRQQFGRTTASVEAMQAAIDRASDSTNIGRGTLQRYARQLSRAGLRGDALTEAVEAMGLAAQVQGDRGANRFRALAINARLTGGSVRDLARDYRDRLGPIARRQMLGMDNQMARLRRSINALFRGLRIEAFLESVSEITSQFSQSTVAGRALRGIIERLLQPLIDSITVVGPLVAGFFQGMIIAALGMEIAILELQIVFRRTFGRTEFTTNLNLLNVAIVAGAIFFGLLVIAALALGAAFVAVGIIVAGWIAVFTTLPALVIAALVGIGLAISEAFDFFTETDFTAMATDMINGLIAGLRSGAARLVQQVRILAVGVSSAFRAVLGIASPSRVFAQFGLNISQGVAQGIDAGAPAVDDAANTLVEAPIGGGLGGAASFTFGDININTGESTDPRELAMAVRDELASILRGVSIEMGTT